MRLVRSAATAALAAAMSLAGFGFATGASGDTTQFVYVSVDGDDAASGTKNEPFQSIERARDAVRELIADGMSGDVVVRLGGGTYHLEESLRLDERDSGRDGHQVVYTTMPGERPVIVGGRPIQGWHPYSGEIYRAEVPERNGEPWTFNQLFVDGRRATLARSPNNGYHRTAAPGQTIPQDERRGKFRYAQAQADIIENIADPSSVQVFMWGNDWFSNTVPIEDVDAASRTVSLAHDVLQPMGPRERFVLQGFAEALDRPGEWYLDRDEGYVYYWPAADDVSLNRQQIIAPTVRDVFDVRGSSPQRRVHDVVVDGLTFEGSAFTDYFMETQEASSPDTTRGRGRVWNRPAERNRHGVIRLENSADVVLRNLEINNAGFSGVSIDEHSRGITVTGSEIHEFGYHGVVLTGVRAGVLDENGEQVYDNRDHVVTDNHIHDGGQLVGHGGGIFVNQSGDNLISHNRIHDMPRYGICIKGLTAAELPEHVPDDYDGPEITWENHFDLLTSRNNVISFNDIFDVIQDSKDAGGISFKGIGKGTVVDNNAIHDIRAIADAKGLYLDDATHDVTVSNNVVHDIASTNPQGTAPINSKGVENRITNNVFDGGPYGGINTTQFLGLPTERHHYGHNIVAVEGNTPLYSFRRGGWFGDWVTHSDDNIFHSTTDTYRVVGIPGADTLANWKTLAGGRYEQNSLTADPLFVDPENDDYRLQPDSPALDVGFEPIDTDSIGLTDEYGRVRDLEVVGNDAEAVELSWSPVPAATSYRVGVSTRRGGPFRTAGESSRTGFRYEPTPAERSRPLYVLVAAVVGDVVTGHSTVLTVAAPVAWRTLVEADFDDLPEGAPPQGWVVDGSGGSVTVEATPDGDGHSLRIVDDAGSTAGPRASPPFDPQTARIRYEIRMRAEQADGGFLPRLTDAAGVTATEAGFAGNGALRYWQRRQPNVFTDIGPFEPGRWYTFVLDADVRSQRYDLSIDGVLVVDDAPFMNPVESIDQLVLPARFQAGTYYVDFVAVYQADEETA